MGGASGYFIGAYSRCGRRQSGGIRFAFVRPKHALDPTRTHPTELPGLKEVTIVRILLRGASYGGASGYFIGAYSPCGRRQSGGIRFAFVRPKHALAPPALTQLSYRG
jgi:hypothetical protein